MTRERASGALAIVACAALVGWFWARGEAFLAANGSSFDEGVHLVAGYSYWTTGNFRFNNEAPPFPKLLWAAPLALSDRSLFPHDVATATDDNHWQVATAFLYGPGRDPQALLKPARRVNLALGCAVVLLAGWWAYRFWGSPLAGVGACGFAVADPNLLALSCVLSTDAALTLFTLLACYLLWEYTARPSRGLLVGAGVALGLALGSKLSALATVAGVGAAGLVWILRGGVLALPGAPADAHRGRAAGEFAFRLGLIALIALAATYGFVHFGQWGSGLKFQLTRGEHGDGMMYLNGELSRRGWLYYFLVLLPLKLPLGLMAALLLVALFAARRVSALPSPSRGEVKTAARLAFVVVPPLVFFALASLGRVNLGVRVVLPVLPFLYVFAAGIGCSACSRFVGRVLLGVCVVWAAISAARSDPFALAYFNELAGGPRGAVRHVADSNVDWGQALPQLKQYLDANGPDVVYLSYFGTDRPEAYGIRFHPLPTYGRVGEPGGEPIPENAARHVVVVSVNNLLGIYLNDPNTFAFLRNREPNAVLGGCLYVFDLTGDADAIRRVRAFAAGR